MRKTIWRRLKARDGYPFIWRVEGAYWGYSAKVRWSCSTPGSQLILESGFDSRILPTVSLGSYDKHDKEYQIQLPNDCVFTHPTEISLTTTGTANVLIALELEMHEPNFTQAGEVQSISDAKNNEVKVLGSDFVEVSMLPVVIEE